MEPLFVEDHPISDCTMRRQNIKIASKARLHAVILIMNECAAGSRHQCRQGTSLNFSLTFIRFAPLKIVLYVSARRYSTLEVHQTHVNMLQGVDTCADKAQTWTLAFLEQDQHGRYLGSALAFLNPTQLELFDPPGHIGPVDLLPKEPHRTPVINAGHSNTCFNQPPPWKSNLLPVH